MPRKALDSLFAAVVFAMAIAVVNGFARFAYALLLPVMRQDLGWDYALSGWLNTANSIGYGVGGLLGALLAARYKPASLFIAGLIATTLTLLLCGLTLSLQWMLLWRFLAGVGSAWVFACGGALVTVYYRHDPAKASAAIAVYYAGGGLGIALGGLVLYPVLERLVGWQTGWMMLGCVAALMMLWPVYLAWQSLRNDATELASIATQSPSQDPSPVNTTPVPPVQWSRYSLIVMAYILFGVGYIVYMTFVIAWLKSMQMGNAVTTALWVLMGLAAIGSGRIWRGPMSRWWPTKTFAVTTLCTCVGSALPLLSPSLPMLVLSVLLVGGSFFMVPGSIMALIRATLPQSVWSKAMSLSTMAFAGGQAVGPVAAGWLADMAGLNAAMLAGAATLLLSAVLASLHKKPAH